MTPLEALIVLSHKDGPTPAIPPYSQSASNSLISEAQSVLWRERQKLVLDYEIRGLQSKRQSFEFVGSGDDNPSIRGK